LLGPSCVGKTTLYNKIGQTSENSRSYKTLKEAYKLAGIHKKIPVRNLKLLFYQWLLKSGLVSYRSRGLGHTILQGVRDKKGDVNLNDYNPYIVSYNILINHLKNEKNPYVLYRHIN